MSRTVFLAPHHDDETLFGAFTLIAHKPLVVVVYDGGPDREAETNAAGEILGCQVEHWRLAADADLGLDVAGLEADAIYAPLPELFGQPQHNAVGQAAEARWAGRVVHYLTYTSSGKSTNGQPVPFEFSWIGLKLQALACYPSQYGHPSCAPHFLRDQTEYVA